MLQEQVVVHMAAAAAAAQGEVGYPTPPYSYRGGNGGDGMESNINGTPVYRGVAQAV